MNQKKRFLFPTLLLFISVVFAQQQQFTDQFIDDCIKEAFAMKANELVFDNANSKRYELIQGFFKNRYKVVSYDVAYEEKGLIDLSTIGLMNKYNSSLMRDVYFNPSTFNPLKYKINIVPTNTEMYKVGSGSYIIIVKPRRNN